MDRACGTYRWAGKGHTGFWWNLKERDHLEHLDIDEKRIILKWILYKEIGLEGMNWINVTHDRDQWWVIKDKEMSIWGPQKFGYFLNS
jgi:hypothetical protein